MRVGASIRRRSGHRKRRPRLARLPLFAGARDVTDARALLTKGATQVGPETVESSLPPIDGRRVLVNDWAPVR